MPVIPHPLSALSIEETNLARDIVLGCHAGQMLYFRQILLLEPPKNEVLPFLELEHSGKLSEDTPRPQRLAKVQYDAITKGSKVPQHQESIVDLRQKERVEHHVIAQEYHAALTIHELQAAADACASSPVLKEKLKEFKLPDGFEVVIEPWPYGAPDIDDGARRFFQALLFARDTRSKNPDSNFYAYPLPLIPVMDALTKEVVRIDELATGGNDDAFQGGANPAAVLDYCQPSEYVPELLPGGTRKDLKPLSVLQPDGPSFTISDGNLVEWQKWRMRVSFNSREGAVIHDIRYQGRPILYRLSLSEMTVPYADPRPPFHRKQAFDFGDGGLGHTVNNLELGCDCLGLIKYFDGVLIDSSGTAQEAKNVICLHEQDNGIGWKHTNWRTNRAVVTRRRELVVQFIITLANYEYIFNFKFDQAAGITVEVRATGIVSVVGIEPGKTASWGKVVNPGQGPHPPHETHHPLPPWVTHPTAHPPTRTSKSLSSTPPHPTEGSPTVGFGGSWVYKVVFTLPSVGSGRDRLVF
ncbi:copper amine oxidase [Diaporthe sp. PMI_573]|nr:copper amine oxidase [Diaporthaceae sp. PMI_573]